MARYSSGELPQWGCYPAMGKSQGAAISGPAGNSLAVPAELPLAGGGEWPRERSSRS